MTPEETEILEGYVKAKDTTSIMMVFIINGREEVRGKALKALGEVTGHIIAN